MRYRSNTDAIVEYNSEETLLAKGDKVFVTQSGTKWKVFSFYTRKLIVILDEENLKQIFVPEGDFDKPRGDGRFKGRNFKSNSLMILICFLSLSAISQVKTVNWSYRAVRVDSNHFEFQITADMYRGWWIYCPNKPDECPYSPLLMFERSPVMKPIERIEVLQYPLYASSEESTTAPPLCNITPYRNNVIFVQLFKMPINSRGVVKGQITYQACSRYYIEPPTTENFSLVVGPEPEDNLIRANCTARVHTVYPRGAFRKTWWFIRHPFGPYYIKRWISNP